jgi:NADPH:quinone reductase-like Zn-dependent oxidoreductase
MPEPVMKAAVRHEYGPPEILRIEEVPTPIPRDDELLIRVHAASVNLGDWELLTGKPLHLSVIAQLFAPGPRHTIASPKRRLFKPKHKILGSDVAGRVDQVGRSVTRYGIGQELFGDCGSAGMGGFAEYVCVPATAALATKPASMTFEEAAAFPQAAFIAITAIRDKARVGAKQKVLINGAGGGAGTLAVQLAKHYGAEVTGVDGPSKLELLRSIDADHVIDYTREEYTANGQRYDVILDLAAHRTVFESRRSLKPNGLYMMAGGSWTALWESAFLGPFLSRGGKGRVGLLAAGWKTEHLTYTGELFEEGKLRPVIDRCYPLEQVGEALRRVGEKQSLGKVIVRP